MVTLILAWGLLELGGFFLIWLALGRPFSGYALQRRRQDQIDRFDSLNSNRFAQVHPYVGYVEEPRADSGVRPFGGTLPVPVSEYGYIDDKLPLQTRGPGRVVIGIMGGSVACLFALNGTRRLEVELAKDTRFAHKELVFVNLALGGYKQPQQLMTLAYLLSLGAEFDLILNIDGFNEVALDEFENGAEKLFPAFPRGWRTRIAVSDTNLGLSRSKLLLLDAERAGLARRFSRSPWRYSILCNLVWVLLDRRLDRQISQVFESYAAFRDASFPYAVTGPRRVFKRDDRYKFLAEIWANCSILMDRLCRPSGTRYHHFLQPNQYFVGSKPMRDAEKQVAILEHHPYSQGVRKGYPLLIRMSEILRRERVSYHDLTGIFAEHPETIYIDDCCHYNQAGNEIMAEAIARAILSDPETKTD